MNPLISWIVLLGSCLEQHNPRVIFLTLRPGVEQTTSIFTISKSEEFEMDVDEKRKKMTFFFAKPGFLETA